MVAACFSRRPVAILNELADNEESTGSWSDLGAAVLGRASVGRASVIIPGRQGRSPQVIALRKEYG